jgi:hypothetical protein
MPGGMEVTLNAVATHAACHQHQKDTGVLGVLDIWNCRGRCPALEVSSAIHLD